MAISTRISPPNSLLLVSDESGGKAPDFIEGLQAWASPSCVMFMCYPEQDGQTEIVMGDAKLVAPNTPPAFDRKIETPGKRVVVTTVDSQQVLQADVPHTTTRVQLWFNHHKWADKVIIGLQ